MINHQNPYMNMNNFNNNQNPYNQYANYQPMQQFNRQPTLVGKVVDTYDSVTINDIPMDGSPATFIKRDMSEIQLRAWNSNGQINTIVFKPIESVEPNNPRGDIEKSLETPFKSLTEVFESNFASINDRFDKLEKVLTPKTGRKKVEDDE